MNEARSIITNEANTTKGIDEMFSRIKIAVLTVHCLMMAYCTETGRQHRAAGKDIIDLCPALAKLADAVWPI